MESNIQKLKGSVIGFTQFNGLDKQERRLLVIAATKKTPLQRRARAATSFDRLCRLGLIDKTGKITEKGIATYRTMKE